MPNLSDVPKNMRWPVETQDEMQNGNVRTTVVLATAMVRIQECSSISLPQRALFDSGAQCSLISKDCVRRLGLRQLRCHLPLRGVGGPVGVLDRKVRVYIRPWFDSQIIIPIEMFVIEQWQSDHPSAHVQKELPPMQGDMLADENYNVPAPIDLLLGAEVWSESVHSRVYRNERGAMMQASSFGYLALGRFALTNQNKIFTTVLNLMAGSNESLENSMLLNAIKQFWAWEEAAEAEVWSPEEQACDGRQTKNCG